MAKPSLKKIGLARRQTVDTSQGGDLVRQSALFADGSLPRLIEPATEGIDLSQWLAKNKEAVETLLLEAGGILFRGFALQTVTDFEHAARAFAGQLLNYSERSSPRSQVQGRVYTSTDYPPNQPIFLHNENSYQHTWPLKIFFFCETAAQSGGETPIADCRKVAQRIDPEIRQRFEDRGWMYVRNFGEGFGLPWQEVFQTSDRTAVEAHCAERGISVEWKEDNRLRVRAVRPAFTRHPTTGDLLWFNHATFFHVSTLSPSVREGLLAEFSSADLPTNSFYGDGSEIEPEVLDHLRQVYREETVAFPWQRGDLLLLDNMMVAHGRAPFQGARKVLVGMAQPCQR